MRLKSVFPWFVILIVLAGSLHPAEKAGAASPGSNLAQSSGVTAYDLILAMNTLRVSNGLSALIEDPIVNAVAQNTADIMAANQMSWHIGDVRGRLAAAGYGGGATVWATENFAVGHMTLEAIMQVWSDPDHMRPATVPAYCHVGAGVAQAANGSTYYVLQAAYTSSHSCGPYTYPEGTAAPAGTMPVSQIIVPVQIATPDADGKIYHIVQAGQSLWSIAISYQVTIQDLEVWNNISRDTGLQIGQRLFIPSSNTEGYATPTPVGMVIASTPDADGQIVHTVQAYQTLTTIALAYEVSVDSILALNGWQLDWPLQIGQTLIISPGKVTPSATPRPLTPIEKLTPASDGNYYHIVQSGETLTWIASLYNVTVNDLMAWNNLNSASIIRPDQKLLLRVTPPATITPTQRPPTTTATITRTTPPPTVTRTPRPTASPTVAVTAAPDDQPNRPVLSGIILSLVAVAGLIVLGLSFRKKHQP